MNSAKSTIATVALAAILVTGCSASNTTLELNVAELPESTLKCLPAPYKGKTFAKINMKQAGYLLARYKTAHADCESKVNTVRKIYYKWKAAAKKGKVKG